MQNCSVPRAPCCPLTRGPTAPQGLPGWGVGAKCLSQVQAQLGFRHPLTRWRVGEQPQLTMWLQSVSVLGWSRKADPGWKIREPPACVLLSMGQQALMGETGHGSNSAPATLPCFFSTGHQCEEVSSAQFWCPQEMALVIIIKPIIMLSIMCSWLSIKGSFDPKTAKA